MTEHETIEQENKPVDLGYEIPEEGIDMPGMMRMIETNLITQALQRSISVASAARLLNLNRTTLVAKMNRLGLVWAGSQEVANGE